jgi:hypothetical protein
VFVQGYDLIGDIHGCGETLVQLLELMDYRKISGVYRHASRKVIFVGDIVDRGPHIREALSLVRSMVEAGSAEIVMGNHEYNVLAYCTQAQNGSDNYLREHSSRNGFIVEETLKQFEGYEDEWNDHLNWFMKLPLFIEKEEFRVVHACWDADLIARCRELYPDECFSEAFLHRSVDRSSDEGKIIDILTRGTALKLPEGRVIEAKDGFLRHFYRTKFWLKNPQLYGDIVFQPDPLPEEIAQRTIISDDREKLLYYDPDEKPLFIGHYWRQGTPKPITPNIACLDYSAVKYGKLTAYRYDGEKELNAEKFVWVTVSRE